VEENEPKRKDEFKMQYFVAHKKETFLMTGYQDAKWTPL
jgi:hypothetical protein